MPPQFASPICTSYTLPMSLIHIKRFFSILAFSTLILLSTACTALQQLGETPEQFAPQTQQISITADGQTQTMTTDAPTVRQVLEDAAVALGNSDEVDPPLFTPVSDGLAIRIVRVSESVETIEQGLPFERRIVRNESMGADDPPQIVQAGQSGLQELTVRIVYRDGLEVERVVVRSTTITASQDEIVMIGLGAATPVDNLSFSGRIAYINGGRAELLRGQSALPEALNTGELDPLRRVFSLSPTGSHLLYSRATTSTASFNSLWVLSLDDGIEAEPRPLGIADILWADWNPQRANALQIAYTTANATDLPPGWEANNDLWLGELFINEETPFEPVQIVDSYPATYGWWGGNYAWSPTGLQIAYSYADEVGLIDVQAGEDDDSAEDFQLRFTRHRFREYDTRAEWVWVPTLTWSPDGRYLAFTRHGTDDPTALSFDTWVLDTISNGDGRLSGDVGIWSYPRWAPSDTADEQIAFLKAVNSFDSLQSGYTLWLMDSDGSNQRQVYPPVGETSYFPKLERFMAWAGDGRAFVFVYDDNLFLYNLDNQAAFQLTQSDTVASHPTWAPYGAAVRDTLINPELAPLPTPTPDRGGNLPDS